MEIELKYNIPDRETAAAIWSNDLFAEYEETGSREEIRLVSKYFDTANCDLARNELAYRVRSENGHMVATLKWKGHSEDGLHKREEINVPVDSDEPDPGVFAESRVGNEMIEFLQDRPLKCILETNILRKSLRIDNDSGIFELAVDEGEIITEYGSIEIHEAEVELYSGETDELVKIGKIMEDSYSLTPDDLSKYAKGIQMIIEHKDKDK
ncbi:MAG: CYTH domain-containing protein [Lentihominibacter sp.]